MDAIFKILDKEIIECLEAGSFFLFKHDSGQYLLVSKDGVNFVLNLNGEVVRSFKGEPDLTGFNRLFLPQKDIRMPMRA